MISSESVQLIPVPSEIRFDRFDLAGAILDETKRNHVSIQNQDIIVVSSKFAAISEGRFVNLQKIIPGRKARKLARAFRLSPALAQLVIEESNAILGGIPGFVLARAGDVLAPNAGIDRSNVPEGWAVLYPRSPVGTARKLRRNLLASVNRARSRGRIDELGVILSDSRVTPMRLGTTGVAIAAAGIRPTIDMRGNRDLFSNKLKVTLRAIADQIASAAQIQMGESIESTPIVIVRGVKTAFEPPRTRYERTMSISPERCLIVSGLKRGNKATVDINSC